MSNTNLIHAKRQKNDEFYTQLDDIETEMQAYLDYDPDVFRGKTILLPCDDPDWSNFTKYFAEQFETLGLKKLISTSYAADGGHGKVFVLDGENEPQWEYLTGDGDFRSAEVTALRDEADIVITNPPFSLFREFVAWMNEGGVSFSVLGNMNAVTYKEIFPSIRDNTLWIGATGMKSITYEVPIVGDVGRSQFEEKGKRYQKMGNTCWFTNIQHGRRHEQLKLMAQSDNEILNKRITNNANSYKKYDNYDAIEVPATSGIPSDYVGVMGVPISFLDKYCPEQFEIVGIAKRGPGDPALKAKVYTKDDYVNYSDLNAGPVVVTQDGPKNTYPRILIRHINPVVQLARVHTLKTATPEPQQMAA